MASEMATLVDAGLVQISGVVLSRFDDGSSEAFQVGRIETDRSEARFVSEYLPGLRPGVLVSLAGYWEHHSEHGRQIRVVQLHSARLPHTPEAVERLLIGVPGFGPAYARKVVGMRGPGVLGELLGDSSLLTKILPGKRGRTLQLGWETWDRQWETDHTGMNFTAELIGLGCTHYEARRVLEFFRSPSTARMVLLRHPYRLLEVPGISWEKTERIGRRLAVPPNDPGRLVAAAVSAAVDLLGKGHSGVPRYELGREVARFLGGSGLLATATTLAIDGGELVDDDLLYLPRALQAEWIVATQLRRLARRTRELPTEREAALREHLEGTTLNAEQREAVENAWRFGVSILTGGPGTGKTTAMKEIVRTARALGETVSIIAPTGRAARRATEVTGVPAATIHKAIGGPPGSTRDTPIRDDLVVVEECSMVSVETMAWLLRNLSGRTRLVLVGDADQLPSIEHGAVLRDILASGSLPAVRLLSVYRQGEESGIIVAARRVISGEEIDGREGPGFYFADVGDEEEDELATQRLRDAVKWLASSFPVQDIQVLSPMKRGPVGTVALNADLQDLLNPHGRPGPKIGDGTVVRVGDRVIQVRNDYSLGEAGIMNGQQGMVAEADSRRAMVTFDDESLWIEDHRLYNLRLAWAITIHKSQGSEWPHVVVAATSSHGTLLNRQILYTALTRAKQNAVLLSNRKALHLAAQRDTGTSRSTGLTRHLGLNHV